ncbi:MAG: porin family protein [Bacteroidota bacterium]
MVKHVVVSSVLFLAMSAFAQQGNIQSDTTLNNRYLEDQFFIGFGYNFLLDRPDGVIQRSLSYSLQMGIIKDIPLNKRRNFGFGLGLGYTTNSYYYNVLAEREGDLITYRLPTDEDRFNRSKLETHGIAFPLELRWRTSTASEYRFWRVYAGFQATYLFSRTSRITGANKTAFRNPDLQQWQYGLMLNFGYNTLNLHIYWALNDLLADNARLGNDPITIRPLRLGLIFYIL